jgi:DNA (cytosine-5)-methyltransferase 1
MQKLQAIDLFSGAGGSSHGAERSGTAELVFGLNHWGPAVATHAANFPNARHINSRIQDVRPAEHTGKVDLLIASPSCTHHSNARGDRPTSDQQRSDGMEVLPWLAHHRPGLMFVENVVEWESWGPVGVRGRPLKRGAGQYFRQWCRAIKELGYDLDIQRLNAADYGAPTSRRRLFIVAKRKGWSSRGIDWPAPTHTRGGSDTLPAWRGAYEIMDWSMPCPSIFSRTRPLAPKTLVRIAAGLRKFVAPLVAGSCDALVVPVQYQLIGRGAGRARSATAPVPSIVAARENHGVLAAYQVVFHRNQDAASLAAPVSTICTSGAHHGVAVPFRVQCNHGDVTASAANGRVHALTIPLGSQTTHNGMGVAAPYIVPQHGERPGQPPRTHEPLQPLPTVTPSGAGQLAMPFVAHYYGTQNMSGVLDPLDTITTKARHALVVASVFGEYGWPAPTSPEMADLQQLMRELHVVDIGFRMFNNLELQRAQGFRDDYVFVGKKHEVTRMIGNSVPPPVPEHVLRHLAG